jgi:outer membrane protein TolC
VRSRTLRAEQQRLKDLRHAMVASERAVSLAQQRYDRGLTDFLNVVDAERQQFAIEDQYTSSAQSAADALIYLYRALGGGWELYERCPLSGIQNPPSWPAFIDCSQRMIRKDDIAT